MILTAVFPLNGFSGLSADEMTQAATWRSLIDTGAAQTCIATHVIEKLGLSHCATTDSFHAGGVSKRGVYAIDLVIPLEDGTVVPCDVQAVEFAPKEARYDLLIGREVLSIARLVMDKDGTFELTI